MKPSASPPDGDGEFTDRCAQRAAPPSRSAALDQAGGRLREEALRREYGEAFREWQASGHAAVWEAVVGDGLGQEAG
ncbi:MAG: hypothetical protein LBT54_08320 [Bifidobacteriaceae bacterium]|nr:hypothetical protein [Bifidobacteriaceae bacterium]